MGQIITFYSYKGGVGRTMALANSAVLLSRYGHKVLIVDWDLEAPGLEFFFKDHFASLTLEQVLHTKGIVDILHDGMYGHRKRKDWSWLENMRVQISVPDSDEPVHLITAGLRDNDYFSRLRELDLESFYAEKKGGDFIEGLRNEWKRNYDFVLIDSRTGITDVGGVCTIQLPDILLLFLTATEQSLRGTVEIAHKTDDARQKLPFDRLSLVTVPIPTRFDTTEEFKIAQNWLSRFETALKEVFISWLPSSIKIRDFLEIIKIPYVPYFSFGEKLAVLEQSTLDAGGLGYAYETIAALIANNFESVELVKDNRSKLVQSGQSRNSGLIRVLMLSANPKETSRLSLDEEARAIDQSLRRSNFRDRFEIINSWSSRLGDLQEVLLRNQPTIIHFSGHGSASLSGELSLEDALGAVRPISVSALSSLFSVLKDNVDCVVLDACYSENQANAIVKQIPYVIGTSAATSDQAAIAFASSFYKALAYGRKIEDAFKLGCLQIDLANISEAEMPILLKKADA